VGKESMEKIDYSKALDSSWLTGRNWVGLEWWMLSFENDKCWKRKTLPTLVTLACLSSLSAHAQEGGELKFKDKSRRRTKLRLRSLKNRTRRFTISQKRAIVSW